ncbi:MAG: hypothetical protein AAF226_19200, partial [Verrucomicrobiota bacterium]
MHLGIREKVALLVILATATSAILVSRVLSNKALQILREHELVDLGEEAQLRGWRLLDRIDSISEDLEAMTEIDEVLEKSIIANDPIDQQRAMAQSLCHRDWQSYLYVDIVELDGTADSTAIIAQSAIIQPDDLWFPSAEAKASLGQHLSELQKIQIQYLPTDTRPARNR